jgi:hypothetical protein
MSRGLGKLQRFILDRMRRLDREHDREWRALIYRTGVDPGFDPVGQCERNDFVYWWDVRRWVEDSEEFGPIMSEALERSTKRALHTLVKRGEIVCERDRYNCYFTKERYQRMGKSYEAFMEGFSAWASK